MTHQFVNNVGGKNFKIIYNNEKIAPKIQHYMFKHIQFLDKIFADIKQAEVIIARAKSQFCISGLKIVGYVCNAEKTQSNTAKLIKILN